LKPFAGPPGTVVQVSGEGLTPISQFGIRIDRYHLVCSNSAFHNTDRGGAFVISITVELNFVDCLSGQKVALKAGPHTICTDTLAPPSACADFLIEGPIPGKSQAFVATPETVVAAIGVLFLIAFGAAVIGTALVRRRSQRGI
jgi:hypothetical protein